MFMTGVLCTVCGAQVYLLLDLKLTHFDTFTNSNKLNIELRDLIE